MFLLIIRLIRNISKSKIFLGIYIRRQSSTSLPAKVTATSLAVAQANEQHNNTRNTNSKSSTAALAPRVTTGPMHTGWGKSAMFFSTKVTFYNILTNNKQIQVTIAAVIP